MAGVSIAVMPDVTEAVLLDRGYADGGVHRECSMATAAAPPVDMLVEQGPSPVWLAAGELQATLSEQAVRTPRHDAEQ